MRLRKGEDNRKFINRIEIVECVRVYDSKLKAWHVLPLVSYNEFCSMDRRYAPRAFSGAPGVAAFVPVMNALMFAPTPRQGMRLEVTALQRVRL